MRRTALPLFAALALVSGQATAAEKPKDKPDLTPHVDVSPMAVPIVWKGRLVNYVFVSLRLELSPKADAMALASKEPFFRDALVRAAHNTPFVRPGDFTHVDTAALTAAMMRESARIAGPGAVRRVVVLSQTPQRLTGLPKPDAPPRPSLEP